MTEFSFEAGPEGPGPWTSWLGAFASAVLVVGVAIWGYQVLSRDVSGVPVIRKASGEVRVAPDPERSAGEQAPHQGLSVNEVLGSGVARDTALTLNTAPADTALTAEDIAPVALEAALSDEVPAFPDDSPLALMNSTQASPDAEVQAPTHLRLSPEQIGNTAFYDHPTARSVLPRARPPGRHVIAAAPQPVAPPAPVSATVREVAFASLPSGTRLVQVGALDSADAARAEWERLQVKFPEYFEGKGRVIQQAAHSGKTFYRLRVEGFADLADSRRFCAVLEHAREACITAAVP